MSHSTRHLLSCRQCILERLSSEIYHQGYVWDPAANAFGFVSSNGGRALIRN